MVIIRRVPPLRPGWLPVGLLCGVAALAGGAGPDEKTTPEAVIRRVADFYGKAKAFRVEDMRTIKAGPAPVQQTTSVAIEQPNKVALHTQEAGAPVDIVSDGKAMSITLGPLKKYVQGKPLASFAAMGDDPITQGLLMGALNGSLIGEMIVPNPYKNVMDGVTSSTYVGLEDVDGVQAHHVKFVQEKMDWEAWVAAKGDPLLLKTVTDLTKSVPDNMKSMKPELTHTFKNWKFDTKLDAKAFAYEPPAGFAKAKSIQEAFSRGDDAPSLVGKPAPTIALTTLDGGKFTLADHKDKDVVIVDFWATWCGPCVAELPQLVEVADSLKEKGVAFMAVNLRENKEKVTKFQADKKLKFPVAFDKDGAVATSFGVQGIPFCAVVDKAGIVRAVHVGFNPNDKQYKEKLTAELEALLAGKPLDGEGAEGKPAP